MNAMIPPVCMKCGAPTRDGLTCHQQYERILALEYQDPGGVGALHHLTVLCYVVQHPNQYSSEALAWASNMLEAILEFGLSGAEVRRRAREVFAPEARQWRVTRSLRPTGSLSEPIRWRMTVADVAFGDPAGHTQRVLRWAQAVVEAMRERRAGTR